MSDNIVHIIKANDNQEFKNLQHPNKLSDMTIYRHYLIVSDEKGFIYIWDIKKDDESALCNKISFQAHLNQRIKKF